MSDPLDRLKTALADRYSIERELGRGGMAVVYLANDVKHGRHVAVKVLLPELAVTLGGERFLQEIRVTANLQHPHILGLYDSGEADGFLYYVMPYVEGESLRDRLKREKQLPVEDALRIAEQVGSALEFAHRHDVIHRDIKPENILLHEGEAMVADFGIALAVKAAGGERLTETGLSIGTPEYMSPEQVAGERDVDARSDIYSLACVLYEMLAGQPPFTGATGQAVLARHVTDEAPPITTVRSGLSAPAAGAIMKALHKAPADRFESAKAFAEALVAKTADVAPELKSIVVLPFENLSPDPNNAFFADGLTEELIAELSGLRPLRVTSRTSAMQFKHTTKGIPTIARELNVRYALEGSVRRSGNSVRITAQLIEASTDAHLWAERYTGELDDVFDLQEQLARRIVEALRVTLTPDEDRRLAARPVEDFRAYDALLRARQEIWACSKEGLERATQLVLQAQQIVGENAVLHATLGFIHAWAYNLGISHGREVLEEAERHASKALALDPRLGLALHALAIVRYKQGDISESVRLVRQAVGHDANAELLAFLGALLATVGMIDQAQRCADEAIARDPLYWFPGFGVAFVELLKGRFDSATSRFQEVADRYSAVSIVGRFFQAQAMAHARSMNEAKALFSRLAATDAGAISDVSELYCRAAERDRRAVAQLIRERSLMIETAMSDEWFPLCIAECLVMVGDEDGALDWLERAVDWAFYNYRYLDEYNSFFERLHKHARFRQIVGKARQRHEAFDG